MKEDKTVNACSARMDNDITDRKNNNNKYSASK